MIYGLQHGELVQYLCCGKFVKSDYTLTITIVQPQDNPLAAKVLLRVASDDLYMLLKEGDGF